MPVCVSRLSLVGRIHEMVGELQLQGRMSCAEVSAIWSLTMHPDLPDYFRQPESTPNWHQTDNPLTGICLPMADAYQPRRTTL